MPLIDRTSNRTYFSVPEVAIRWRISAQVVREIHIKRQGLQGYVMGGRMLIPLDGLLVYERKRMNALRGEIKKRQRMLRLLEALQGEAQQATVG